MSGCWWKDEDGGIMLCEHFDQRYVWADWGYEWGRWCKKIRKKLPSTTEGFKFCEPKGEDDAV